MSTQRQVQAGRIRAGTRARRRAEEGRRRLHRLEGEGQRGRYDLLPLLRVQDERQRRV